MNKVNDTDTVKLYVNPREYGYLRVINDENLALNSSFDFTKSLPRNATFTDSQGNAVEKIIPSEWTYVVYNKTEVQTFN